MKLRKVLSIGFVACLVLCAGALGFIRWSIQNGLDEWCAKAQKAHLHPGDDAAALIAYVQSDSHSLHDRNLAVWALGQARDERALPVLQAFVTGEKCDHSKNLCQHEVKKALELSGKDPINILRIRPPRAIIAMCRYERHMAYWIMARKNPSLCYRLCTGSGSRLICETCREYEIFRKYLVNSYQIVYHDVWRKKPNNNASSGLRKNEFRIS